MTLYKSPDANRVERQAARRALREKGQAIVGAMATRAFDSLVSSGSRELEVVRLMAAEDDPVLPGVYATDVTVNVHAGRFSDRTVTLNLVRPTKRPGHLARFEDSPEELVPVQSSLMLTREGKVHARGHERSWNIGTGALELAVVAWDGLSRVRALDASSPDEINPNAWRTDLVALAGEMSEHYPRIGEFSAEEALFGPGVALEPAIRLGTHQEQPAAS